MNYRKGTFKMLAFVSTDKDNLDPHHEVESVRRVLKNAKLRHHKPFCNRMIVFINVEESDIERAIELVQSKHSLKYNAYLSPITI